MTRKEKIEHLAQRYVEEGLLIEDVIEMAMDCGEQIAMQKKQLDEHYKNAVKYVGENVAAIDVGFALEKINERKCNLQTALPTLADHIFDLMEDYTIDNDLPDGWWQEIGDVDDIFWRLEV